MKKNVTLISFMFVLFFNTNINAQNKTAKKNIKFDESITKEMIEIPRRVVLRSVEFNSPSIIEGDPKKIFKTPSGYLLFTNKNGLITKYWLSRGCSIVGIKEISYTEYQSLVSNNQR